MVTWGIAGGILFGYKRNTRARARGYVIAAASPLEQIYNDLLIGDVEGRLTTPCRPLFRVERGSGVGHENAFPRPRLSVRCQFSQGTFARPRGNGGNAPKVALPLKLVAERG